ncbi:unnamed protein product [Soboliphyme baturini]|uniref:Uncharacterized protein n=1 Tax=Soboliphyme baturini TaxID=241478 RepID=A0A183J417_9BILA|nr:unnamed protein product [Soboliphyme baturini]
MVSCRSDHRSTLVEAQSRGSRARTRAPECFTMRFTFTGIVYMLFQAKLVTGRSSSPVALVVVMSGTKTSAKGLRLNSG